MSISRIPPLTWKELMLMPKNSSIFSPKKSAINKIVVTVKTTVFSIILSSVAGVLAMSAAIMGTMPIGSTTANKAINIFIYSVYSSIMFYRCKCLNTVYSRTLNL